MKLVDQCVTLEQAKKISEFLSFYGEGVYSYRFDYTRKGDYMLDTLENHLAILESTGRNNETVIEKYGLPSYTTAELGKFLNEAQGYWICSWYSPESWICEIVTDTEYEEEVAKFEGSTEAEARGNALIWLLENGLISRS